MRLKPGAIISPSVENLKFKVDERLYEIPIMARPVEPKIEESLNKEEPEVRLRAFRAIDDPETCALLECILVFKISL